MIICGAGYVPVYQISNAQFDLYVSSLAVKMDAIAHKIHFEILQNERKRIESVSNVECTEASYTPVRGELNEACELVQRYSDFFSAPVLFYPIACVFGSNHPPMSRGRVECDRSDVIALREEADQLRDSAYDHSKDAWASFWDGNFGSFHDSYGKQTEMILELQGRKWRQSA